MRRPFVSSLLTGALIMAATPMCAATPHPDPARLKATITPLVQFGTRHTLSTTTDPNRGIGAARQWVRTSFEDLGRACGGCLQVETVGDSFSGPRAPQGVRVEDVIAIQHGSARPDQVIIVQAHVDSRASDVMDTTIDAPGANDDGSGVALVMEAARILSREHFPATIIYAVLSGEEQGLWGGKLLAATAKARNWNVQAVLNNDIVGNTHGIGGQHITDRIRVFSEGVPAAADKAGIATLRATGGEDDTPSRALAKTIARIAQAHKQIGLHVVAVRRPDRFQRGGDHTPFLEAGYPAVRFTEPAEHYDREHQNVRVENGRHYGDVIDWVDFRYLAKVTALDIAVLRELASAPPAPTGVVISGALSDDTHVRWMPVFGAAKYRVRWRSADTADWQMSRDIPASATALDLPHVNIDDHFFGLSALSTSGAESLVTFGGVAPTPPVGSTR